MHQKLRLRMLALELADALRANPHMGMTGARPQMNAPPRLELEPLPKIHIRDKKNLFLLRDGVNDRDRIGGGAANIAFRLDGGGGVDITDNNRLRMFLFPGPKRD